MATQSCQTSFSLQRAPFLNIDREMGLTGEPDRVLLKQSMDQVSAPVSPAGRGLGKLKEKHSSLVLCPGASLWCLQSLRPWGVFSLSCTLLCFPLLICRATLACYSSRPFFKSSTVLFGGGLSGIYRLTIYRFLFVLLTRRSPSLTLPGWIF